MLKTNAIKKLLYSPKFYLGLAAAVTLVFLLLPEEMEARPGGGHSYRGRRSGGGGRSYRGGSSSGGGGGGDLVRIFFLLPGWLQITIIIIAIIIFIYKSREGSSDYSPVREVSRPQPRRSAQRREYQIEQFQANVDANFSAPVFLDFAHSLYNKLYKSLGEGKSREISPFFSEQVKQQMKSYSKGAVSEIVIGNMTIDDMTFSGDKARVIVDFEANYTTTGTAGRPTRHIVEERWVFTRALTVLSPEPEAVRALSCPSCGAPADFNDAGVCGHCNTLVEAGDMDWMVDKIIVQHHEYFKAESLGSYGPVVNPAQFSTLRTSNLEQRTQTFLQRHGISDATAFWNDFEQQIVRQTFVKMYEAWSNRDNWKSVRPLLSDRLYESNLFWIKAYQKANYYNRLEQIAINQVEPVRIRSDKYYESFTVRVWAKAIDYTEDANGKIIGGNKRRAKAFSEYWTFIRHVDSGIEKGAYDINTCPSCGAPADNINESSVCGYCNSKLSNGEHSWVLNSIVQDQAYKG